MVTELKRLAHEYKKVNGINTVKVMNLDIAFCILKGEAVVYVCIFFDHRPQTKYSYQASVLVGNILFSVYSTLSSRS